MAKSAFTTLLLPNPTSRLYPILLKLLRSVASDFIIKFTGLLYSLPLKHMLSLNTTIFASFLWIKELCTLSGLFLILFFLWILIILSMAKNSPHICPWLFCFPSPQLFLWQVHSTPQLQPGPPHQAVPRSLSLSLSLLLTSLPFSTPLPLLFTRLLHLALPLHPQCNMFKRELIFSPKRIAHLAFYDSVNCSSILSLMEVGIYDLSDWFPSLSYNIQTGI